MMEPAALLPLLLALAVAPLLLGIISRVKAIVAGRTGPPLLQAYFDLRKLLGKGAVYSTTTTLVVRAGPTFGLAAIAVAVLVVPLGPLPSALAFQGDLLLVAGLLALQRFSLMLAALDTGSSFEGMGASREAFFATLAEPALLVGLLVAARGAGNLSLSTILGAAGPATVAVAGPALLLVAVALFLVFLAENSRIPVDDPNTHLELTMVHEVMVLDHGGVDLAYITYAAALKMWLLGAILVGLLLPASGLGGAAALAAMLVGMLGLAALTGLVESTTARLKMDQVPRLLASAGGLAVLALLLVLF